MENLYAVDSRSSSGDAYQAQVAEQLATTSNSEPLSSVDNDTVHSGAEATVLTITSAIVLFLVFAL
jgi:hypothetical protein